MNPQPEQVSRQHQEIPGPQVSFIVRPMAPRDVPSVVAIDRLSFPTPWPASSYLYELLESSQSLYRVLVKSSPDRPARSGRRWYQWIRGVLDTSDVGEVTGYVGFRMHRNEAHISTIAVHPDWRARGLGELLLLTTVDKALMLGARRVTLEVRASNEVAQQLYRKYGFEFTGTRRGYYRDGEDAWLMAAQVGSDGYREQLGELHLALNDRLRGEGIRISRELGDRV